MSSVGVERVACPLLESNASLVLCWSRTRRLSSVGVERGACHLLASNAILFMDRCRTRHLWLSASIEVTPVDWCQMRLVEHTASILFVLNPTAGLLSTCPCRTQSISTVAQVWSPEVDRSETALVPLCSGGEFQKQISVFVYHDYVGHMLFNGNWWLYANEFES